MFVAPTAEDATSMAEVLVAQLRGVGILARVGDPVQIDAAAPE